MLVFVAAGLCASAVHAAHEAGIVTVLQSQAVDLTWMVRPGTPLAALFTGMLGMQPQPTTAEVIVYFAYLLPMLAYVLWPARRPATAPPPRPVQMGVGS